MRISEKDYYFKVVEAVALRGTCDRGRSGAVFVKKKGIIVTGYVGAPVGLPHCDDVGHELVSIARVIPGTFVQSSDFTIHCVRTVHAEMNGIIRAAREGRSLEGSTLYCTMFPCITCAMALVNVGIVGVYAQYDYQQSQESKDLFERVKIHWVIDNYKTPGYEANGL